jgi:chromosome partitioning protein
LNVGTTGQGVALATVSQKGGVGKTTLALNASYAFARRGWKTLIMDADPQGCIGTSLRGSTREHKGLVQVLTGARPLSQCLLSTRVPELKILPLGPLSARAAAEWSFEQQDGEGLGRALDDARSQFDLVVVDTPSGMAGSARGVLLQTDYAVVPMQAEPLAARSIGQVLEVFGGLRERGARVRLIAFVLTMLQSRQERSLAVALDSWRMLPPSLVLEATVPRDNVFLEASGEGVPVALLRRRPPAVAAVFDQIAAEIELRINPDQIRPDERAIPLLD